MNREINFRAWDIAANKMLNHVGYHPSIIERHTDYEEGSAGQYTISPSFTNYKLMQYTGLKDKYGVEIYEGDVLETVIDQYANTAIVKFGDCFHLLGEDGFCGWYLEFIKSTFPVSAKGCQLNNSIDITSIVIGNIHQNPELL